jgi:hypothetical protein
MPGLKDEKNSVGFSPNKYDITDKSYNNLGFNKISHFLRPPLTPLKGENARCCGMCGWTPFPFRGRVGDGV